MAFRDFLLTLQNPAQISAVSGMPDIELALSKGQSTPMPSLGKRLNGSLKNKKSNWMHVEIGSYLFRIYT